MAGWTSMRRRGEPEDPEDDSDSDDESDPEEPEDEETTPAPPRRSASAHRRSATRPVRPWTIEDLDEEGDDLRAAEEEVKKTGGWWSDLVQSLRRPVFFRARDSWYFEPLLALAIIVLLLVSLYAYTSNWPPVYVVESGSMQHGSGDTVGLINTGDLVLVKHVDPSTVTTYVEGEQTGYTTYGEYGDVVLYHPNGDTSVTPVIHRAILYLEWVPSAQAFTAPSLVGLPCGSAPDADYSVSGAPGGCAWSGLVTTITLYHVGWRSATVVIPLATLGHYSGFVTMGDNNLNHDTPPQGETDQMLGISGLVSGGWIIGVARGMVPWVGAFKLLIEGNAGAVPTQSWQFLALTLSAIVLAGFGLHYLFRVEGIEDPRRLEEERKEARDKSEEAEGGPEEWEERPKGSRWKGLHRWLATPEEEEEEATEPSRRSAKPAPHAPPRKEHGSAKPRGRPHPAVKKTKGWLHRRTDNSSKHTDDDSL